MRTGKRIERNSTPRWEIILGVLFVVSFLGVTLALALGDAIATPNATTDSAVAWNPITNP